MNKDFLVRRGQSGPLQPLRPTSKDHAWRSIPMPLHLLVFLPHGFLPPELFLVKCQDSASRTTASSKLSVSGEPQVWVTAMTSSEHVLFLHLNSSGYVCGMEWRPSKSTLSIWLLSIKQFSSMKIYKICYFNISVSGKNNILNWNIQTSLCVFWQSNF